MSRTPISVIGLGLAVAPHIQSIRNLEGKVEILHCATRSEERAAAFTAQWGLPAHTDVESAIGDPRVEAVFILTPPNTHRELAESALARGKHVLLEKPLDLTSSGGHAIVKAAEDAGLTLGVCLQHRFHKSSLRLVDLLEDGRLGRVELATCTVPWWREQTYYDVPGRGTRARDGGGVLMTQAIHTLDLFRSLVDPVEVLAAQVRTTGLHRMETEDYAAAILQVASGVPGSLMATTAFFPGLEERILIGGSEGSAEICGNRLQVTYRSGETERVEGTGGTGGGSDPMNFAAGSHQGLIEDFLAAARSGTAPRASGREALKTQLLIDAIVRAGTRSVH